MDSATSDLPLLFLHRDISPIVGNHKIDLVLTPQFYLTRRDDIPVRFSFQARRLAPSILEELGPNESMRYEVLREEDGWRYFAYDQDEVFNLLRQKGISPQMIRHLYFAQQFAPELHRAALINGGEFALILLDGIVTMVPANLVDQETVVNAEKLPRPARSFRISGGEGDREIPRSLFSLLAFGGVLLLTAWLIEAIHYHRTAGKIEAKLNEELSRYPALESKLTRDNIYAKYHAVDTRQRLIRQTLRHIGLLTSKSSKLVSLRFDKKGYRAEIDATPGKISELLKIAQKYRLPAKREHNRLIIEGKWQ